MKSPKDKVLVLFLGFSAAAHTLRVNCDEMDGGNKPRHFASRNC